MAVWQFDLHLIPVNMRARDASNEGWGTPALSQKQVRTLQETLAHYFGPPWLMLEDWLVFGPENGNRADIEFDDVGASMFVRCDVRIEAPQFLVLVAELARSNGCRFLRPATAELIEPELHQLLQAMARARLS
ncbi:hypothetical protein CNX70_18465 [Janthinobacterium svalbardensis]|uniref:Uncharacterized protein n=1 Tax=Janthinobacterium svalbardensis TaxID=368607 RepID=A0A290WYG4_9BURK|nr:hypothetical protein [Janthinobacterium svalbardensis]ATD61924.1 hypothetical protein CNX70_18465 [Janthinobacterium svalbardensis]